MHELPFAGEAPIPPASPESRSKSIGVYVHFPYCLKKCGYCDFLSLPLARESIPHALYADAVIAELEQRASGVGSLPLRSVFFGGGTPSLWDPTELGRVLSAILQAFPRHPRAPEITVECNPSSFDPTTATRLRDAGVNRISLGVQSLDPKRLAFLGRLHDAQGAMMAIDAALEAGFPQVSADLIFGVADQSPAAAAQEALALAATGLSHLSAYALTIEPGTQFGELARRGRLPLLSDDLVAESFSAVEAALESRGLFHYEISNYARPGCESRHNLGYWRGEPYVGLGAGAWGTIPTAKGPLRYRNTPAADRYLDWATSAEKVDLNEPNTRVSVVEALSPETALSERLMLGLRLREGLSVSAAQAETGAELWTDQRRRGLKKWTERGAVMLDQGDRLTILRSHWLLADGIVADLL